MVIATYNLRNLFDAGARVGYSPDAPIEVTKEFVDKVSASIRSVIDEVKPDVLIAQEIGSARVFQAIAVVHEPKYETFVAKSDARGIANGVLHRGVFESQSLTDVAHFPVFVEGDADAFGKHLTPYRAFVYVKAEYRGKPLHVIGVHLKTSWGV